MYESPTNPSDGLNGACGEWGYRGSLALHMSSVSRARTQSGQRAGLLFGSGAIGGSSSGRLRSELDLGTSASCTRRAGGFAGRRAASCRVVQPWGSSVHCVPASKTSSCTIASDRSSRSATCWVCSGHCSGGSAPMMRASSRPRSTRENASECVVRRSSMRCSMSNSANPSIRRGARRVPPAFRAQDVGWVDARRAA